MAQEKERSTREGISEEALAICDIMAANISLDEEGHARFRQTANEILTSLRPLFDVPDWQKQAQVSSRVGVIIEDNLLKLPEIPSGDVCEQKLDELILYIRKRHGSDGSSSVA